MKLQRRVVITAVLSAGLATFTTTSGAHAPDPLGAAMNYGNTEPSGVHDFDFFVGRWRVHHRRLKERVDFSILCRLFQQECRKLECGAANMTAEIGRGTSATNAVFRRLLGLQAQQSFHRVQRKGFEQ